MDSKLLGVEFGSCDALCAFFSPQAILQRGSNQCIHNDNMFVRPITGYEAALGIQNTIQVISSVKLGAVKLHTAAERTIADTESRKAFDTHESLPRDL